MAQGAYQNQAGRVERPGLKRNSLAESRDRAETQAGKRFSFSLGKLGIRYEVEEPHVDTDELARQALGHFQRQQEAAFRAELEVEELRRAIAQPPEDEFQVSEPGAALPQPDAPRHVLQAAHRAYDNASNVTRSMQFRPGVHIGKV